MLTQARSFLQVFSLKNNSLSGSLPASWGNSNTSFRSLSVLALDGNAVSGSLPADWNSGWPSLS